LLVDVPKIEVEISDGDQPIGTWGNNVLNYRGANPGVNNFRLRVFDSDKPEYALPGARYKRRLSAAIVLEM
jgi:hypothetical protein